MRIRYLLSALTVLFFLSSNVQAQKKKRHYAYINTKGEVVIDTDYKWADDFHNGRAQFKKVVVTGNKAHYNYGFIDKTGKEVIPAIYEKVYEFKTDVTWVKKRGEDKFILIDLNGNRVGNTSWDAVGFWFEGMCQVKVAWDDPNRYSGTSYKQGFVNKKGELVIDPKDGYFGSGFYNEGLVCLTQEGKGYGFLDKEGKVVIPLMYKQAGSSTFYGGLARVKSNGKTGLINKKNEWVVKPKYGTVSGFGDSLLTVAFGSSYNNFGYVNFNNEIVIKGQFDGAESFKGGFARVDKDGKYGIINKKGEFIIPMEHYSIYNDIEESGFFRALNDRKFTYYDRTGKQISEIEAKSKAGYKHGVFPIRDADGNVQYYNDEGKLISNAKFCNGFDHSEEGLALVQLCDGVNYAKGQLIQPGNSESNEPNIKEEKAVERGNKSSWKTHTNSSFKTSFIVPGKVKEAQSKSKKGLPKTQMQSLTDDALVKVTVDQLSGKIKSSKKAATLTNSANKVASSMGGKVIEQPETFTLNGETAVKQIFVKDDIYFLYVVSSKSDLFYQWIFAAKKADFGQHTDFLKSIKML